MDVLDVSQSTISSPQVVSQYAAQPATLPDVRLGRKHETLPARCRRSLFGLLAKHPRLHGFAMELGSFLWRSEFLSRLHANRLTMEYGPAVEKDASGRSRPNRRTHARMTSTETFLSTCPKATLFEIWVFLQGWSEGERFALRSSDTQGTVESRS